MPVELGSSYLSADYCERLLRGDDFIDQHLVPRNKNEERETGQSGLARPNRGDEMRKGYLAQHKLFDQVPELRKDVEVYSYSPTPTPPN